MSGIDHRNEDQGEDACDLKVDQILVTGEDHWRVTEPLGHGGMGWVVEVVRIKPKVPAGKVKAVKVTQP
jgi:hypothetical protein